VAHSGTVTGRLLGGMRRLRRAPVFVATAVVVLALGVGALTAVATLVGRVVLRPLPVHDQDRVVVAWTDEHVRQFAHFPYTAPMFEAAERGGVPAFASVAAVGSWGTGQIVLEDSEGPTTLRWARTLGDFFGVLGVDAVAGRMPTGADDRPGAPERIAVISDALWARRFGRAPSAVGTTLVTRIGTYTIVGVAPADFEYPRGAEVWSPTRPAYPDWAASPPLLELDLLARLSEGATIAQAEAQLRSLPPTPELERLYANASPVVHPFESVVLGEVRPTLYLLLGGALLVLLVAALDLANLVLVRGVAARRDVAVRRALGADARELTRDAAAEAAVLWTAGTSVGVGLAWLAVRVLLPFAPAGLPRLERVGGLDPWACVFAGGVSLAVVVAAVLLPMRHASGADPASSLGGRSGGASRADARLRRVIVGGQIALGVWVAAVGLLTTRSLAAMRGLDPGFRPEQLWTVALDYSDPTTGNDAHPGWLAELESAADALRASPGVVDVTLLQMPPLPGNGAWQSIAYKEGQTAEEGRASNPYMMWEFVLPNVFDVLGTSVVRGRAIDDGDAEGAPRAVVINESAARAYWPRENVIGQRIWVPWAGGADRPWTVVGVVRDTRYGVLTDLRPSIYYPLRQTGMFRSRQLLVRTDGSRPPLMTLARGALADHAPMFRPLSVESARDRLSEPLVRPRFAALLLAVFAGTALLLAAVGVYGVMTHLVRSRRREIGVRQACGATPRASGALVLRQALTVALAGAAVGVSGAVASGSVFRALLFGVGPMDPVSLGLGALTGVLVAALACWLPAWRAATVDPAIALRAD
jgi:putative ABC transport system permease protein